MSIDRLAAIINSKKQQNDAYRSLWEAFRIQFRQILNAKECEELEGFQVSYMHAHKQFLAELEEPCVIFATTGTTSSGKSSLVNLLCGEEIMPVAVQEMSAGVVVVEHDDRHKVLEIEHTPGAVWDCGTWNGLSVEEIRERLTSAMDAYNRTRNTPQEPQCPNIRLVYPTRIGLEREILGIPSNFKIRIMDLPGLKYVGDEGNAHVIRECREALAIVTYNSFETDPVKQEKLLGEVVTQVKEIGGSPARMLFVLNRIDAFRQDKGWPETENRFVQEKVQQIQELIAKELPEYSEQAQKLEVIRLSTQPALCAYLASHTTLQTQRHAAMREVMRLFSSIVPEELLEELPWKVEKWSDTDLTRVADAVWRTSYAVDFHQALKQHVESNLPELMFPPLLKRFVDGAISGLSWSDQKLHAIITMAEDRYDEECQRLSQVRSALEESRRSAKRLLFGPLEQMPKQPKIDDFQNASDQMGANLAVMGLSNDITASFYNWSHQFGNTIEAAFEPIYDAIIDGRSQVQADIFEVLPIDIRSLLNGACHDLKHAGFHGERAENGWKLEAETSTQKARLQSINMGLNALARSLAVVLRRILEQAAKREERRIYDAMERIFEGYRQYIAYEASQIAPEMVALRLPSVNLGQVAQNLTFTFQFEAGFPVRKATKQVQTGTKRVKTGTRTVKKKEKRFYTLWLYNHEVTKNEDVYESRPVYERRSYQEAIIPSIGSIVEGFIEQAVANLPEIERHFSHWLFSQFNRLTVAVEEYQESLMSEYQGQLDEAKMNAEREKTRTVAELQPLQRQLSKLKSLLPKIQSLEVE